MRILAILAILLAQMPSLAQTNSSYPVFVSQEPPPFGIYQTSNEYLNLHPGDTQILFQHVAQISGDGFNYFYIKTENGRRGKKVDPASCFAASDGKTFYISYSGEWHKATKTD